jgi:Ca-activated chloride channel family protein
MALALLLVELLIMEKGFRFNFRLPALRLPGKFGAAALVLLLPCAHARAAGPGAEARKGNAAYGKEDWQAAVEHYTRALSKSPSDKRLNFNIGDAYFRMKEYDKAGEAFDQAAASPKVAAKAHYNHGNAFFQKGDFSGAIASYRKALTLAPGDENVKFNLQKALEQKKKNSCSNPREDKDKEDQEKKKDKKDQKPGGDKDNQDKESRKQSEQEKKKAEARERSKQILEMMKEKEKAAARDPETMRQAALRNGKPPPTDRLEDW